MILLLGACAAVDPSSPDPDPDPSGTSPSPWEYQQDPPAPDHGLDQLQTGLSAGLSALLALDPILLYQAYADSLDQGTETCPGLFPSVGAMSAWSADCTTAEGWSFSGRGQAAWLLETTIEGQPLAPYGEFINTSTIQHPTGAVLAMDGSGTIQGWSEGAASRLAYSLLGTFANSKDGGEGWIAPSWLDAGPSLALEVERAEDGSRRSTSLEGGISGSFADGIVALRAEALSIEEDGGCEAAGALVLVGEEGQQYRLELAAGQGCEPCTELQRDGCALGEACLDLSPFVSWTERPW